MSPKTPALALPTRWLGVALACLLLGTMSMPAHAGDLSDFRDSVDRDNAPRRARRSSHSAPPRPPYRAYHTHQAHPSSEDIGGTILAAMFAGHRPKHRFSWGETPYDRRGYLTAYKLSAADLDLSRAVFRPRPGHVRARAEASMLADGSAIGLGFFALVEGTHTPGAALSHHQLMDFGERDRLGITALTLEPRFISAPSVVWSWNVGPVVYGSEKGIVNAGLQLGTGVHVTPLDPLSFEARFAVHIMSGLAVADVNLIAGVEFVDGIFATIGYRGFVGPVFALHSATLGLQFDFGFGGPRLSKPLAIAHR